MYPPIFPCYKSVHAFSSLHFVHKCFVFIRCKALQINVCSKISVQWNSPPPKLKINSSMRAYKVLLQGYLVFSGIYHKIRLFRQDKPFRDRLELISVSSVSSVKAIKLVSLKAFFPCQAQTYFNI